MSTRTHLLWLFALAAPLVACAPDGGDETGEDDAETSADALKDVLKFDAITHNIAGGMTFFGAPAALDVVEDEIGKSRPDAVMLQEVCKTQFDAFAASHPAWTMVYTETRAQHPNCGSLGNVIASPHGLTNIVETDLGMAETGKRTMLVCGDVSFEKRKGSVRVCSTHLRSKGQDPVASEIARRHQVAGMVATLKPFINADQAVVVGGDMNSGPQKDILDPMYRLKRNGNWGGGQFDEVDQTDAQREKHRKDDVVCAQNACRSGEPTHDNSKMDHIFFSHNRIEGEIDGIVGKTGKSDHNLLRGSAVLRLPKKKKS